MNVTDAAYDTVHQYPGGSEALAPRLGMSAAVLRGKVNPNTDRNLLSLQEADALMARTGDYRILHALAATHGFVLQASTAPKGGTIITAMLAAQAAKGDLAELVADAMADDRISSNESDRITRGVMQVIVKLLEVSQHAEAAAERGGA